MTVFKFKTKRTGPHVRCAVFVGEDEDKGHLAKAGDLCFRHEEYLDFMELLYIGVENSSKEFEILEEEFRC